GPAKYLFTPLALAVVFAMLASYILSRTLVPLLARLLMPGEEHAAATPSPLQRKRDEIWDRFQAAYGRALETVLAHRRFTLVLALVLSLGGVALLTVVGTDFFPAVDAGLMKLHFRAPAGTRIEETERLVEQVEGRIRDDSRGRARDRERHDRGAAVLQPGVRPHGQHRSDGRRDPDRLEAGPSPDGALHARAAGVAAAGLSGLELLLPAGRHREPGAQLRRGGAGGRADRRGQPDAVLRGGTAAARRHPHGAGRRGRAYRAGARLSGAQGPGRSRARGPAGSDPAGRGEQYAHLALVERADRAVVLPEPGEQRKLRRRGADAHRAAGVGAEPARYSAHTRRRRPAGRRERHARARRAARSARRDARQRGQRVSRRGARRGESLHSATGDRRRSRRGGPGPGRCGGRHPFTYRRAGDAADRHAHHRAGARRSDERVVPQLGIGPDPRDRACVLPDGGAVSVLGRSVHHHGRGARYVGGHPVDARPHRNDAERRIADG